jgi:hypothetical protein
MKKKMLFIVFSVLTLLLLGSCNSPRNIEGLDDDDYILLSVVEGVNRLFQQHPDAVWPGYNLAKRPYIVYSPGRWTLLINTTGDIQNFEPYPKDWPYLGTDVLYHSGQFEDLAGQLAFYFKVDTIVTAAIGFPPGYPDKFENPEVKAFGYIVHEAFHQYQYETFGEIPWEREERYPIQDMENSALAYIEMCLLRDALRQVQFNDRQHCREYIEQFVAMRKHRWDTCNPFIARYEQGQELREATARYVEMKSIEIMSGLDYKSSLQGYANPLTDEFSSVAMPDYIITDFENRMAEGYIPTEDMFRNRIYPVGAAMGFLLDFFEVDWKGKAEQGGKDFKFADLFAEGLDLDERKFDELIRDAEDCYGYDEILAATRGAWNDYLTSFNKELEIFDSQPGYRVEIDLSSRNQSRSRVSRSKKWVMNSGNRTLCSDFKVYTLKGKELILQVHDAGVLEDNDWDVRRRKITFYATDLGSILSMDKPVVPVEDSTYTFETIEMNGENYKLGFSNRGTITLTDNRVMINLMK